MTTEVTLNKSELIMFHENVFLEDKPFLKTYEIKLSDDKTIKVVFRTKTSEEANILIETVVGKAKADVDVMQKLQDYNLAFSLYSFNDVSYDKGSLEERLQRIQKMQLPKKMTLWDMQKKFDTLVEEYRTKLINF